MNPWLLRNRFVRRTVRALLSTPQPRDAAHRERRQRRHYSRQLARYAENGTLTASELAIVCECAGARIRVRSARLNGGA
jgi:hypothetical protein